ncbi:hypothetical protein PAXRUDRAFT_829818 [Paxillus rubicundulus Ve08.2h10]|uniref:Protein-lysine N-methyltransferase EFM2 n=1 Tax=Paxillus rubicundulus Ve08.2h10 TaxID=930991 RepID=A0A0D0D6V2_9AGAM|nr:hypothetical protein PAXRUDRAFT_829818 [Paxillus rubicundulus Ve08.2h10]
MQPPTSYLPPIARIATFTTTQLLDALAYLKSLYLSEVRGSRRRRVVFDSFDDKFFPSTFTTNPHPNHDNDIQLIRSDPFERSYAIRWLTVLISQLEAWEGPSQSGKVPPAPSDLQLTRAHIDTLIQQAASLLAICAGVSAAGRVQRVFSFHSSIAGRIEVLLTDIPLENQDYGSVGAQTWGGACVLAEMMVEHPDRLGLRYDPTTSDVVCPPRALRVLELGAGTGLVALTAAKLMQALPAWKFHQTTVVATDFHPIVLDNLRSNIETNFSIPSTDHDYSIPITSHFLDWSCFPLTKTKPDVFSSPFDTIFGADVVYEAQHAVWIHECLKSLLRCPESSDTSVGYPPAFHLVVPLRPTHALESSTIEAVFGWKHDRQRVAQRELVIFSKEFIICEAHDEARIKSCGDNDVEYLYYRIGWSM